MDKAVRMFPPSIRCFIQIETKPSEHTDLFDGSQSRRYICHLDYPTKMVRSIRRSKTNSMYISPHVEILYMSVQSLTDTSKAKQNRRISLSQIYML